MSDNNPYSTPEGELITNSDEYNDAKIFGTGTRIGRLRYLARVFCMSMLLYALIAVFGGIAFLFGLGEQSTIGVTIFGIGYAISIIVSMVFSFMFMIQRLHDLNRTGWLLLLMLIPLVNLFLIIYILFFPGTQGSNDHGLQPPPNTLAIKLTAILFPLFIAILAAIAFPAYMEFLEKAKAIDSKIQQQSQEEYLEQDRK